MEVNDKMLPNCTKQNSLNNWKELLSDFQRCTEIPSVCQMLLLFGEDLKFVIYLGHTIC